MAELSGSTGALAAMTPIPARVQLVAVAWLRWRLFVNTFFRRRSKGKLRIGGLVFAIVLRIFLWPVLAVMVLGPVAFSGFLAWELMSEGHLRELTPVLAGLMIFWQFVSINGMNIATATKTALPGAAHADRTDDTEHDCGLPGVAGRGCWDWDCAARPAFARADGDGRIRIDERILHAHAGSMV